jgi:hypothetical protein
MASSSERVPVFYGQVATTQWARWIGWLVLVPLTVLFCLLGLSLLALALRLWFAQHNLETVFLCALMSVLCFLVTYLVSGWVHDFLATYQVTQDGLIKSSPFRMQRVRWEQIVKLRWEAAEDVWWLMDCRGCPLLAVDWHLLPPDQLTTMLRAHLFQHFQKQWETLFAEWATKGKVFRPSPGSLLGEGLGSLTFIALAITFWGQANLFWKALWAFIALRGIWGIKETLRLLTFRLSVRGDWLFVSELFRTTRLHLWSVTGVVPIYFPRCKRIMLEGLELKSDSARVRFDNELPDFLLLCLYLASKLPSPWNDILRAVAIGMLLATKKSHSFVSPCPRCYNACGFFCRKEVPSHEG